MAPILYTRLLDELKPGLCEQLLPKVILSLKKIFPILLFVLAGCQTPQEWIFRDVVSDSPRFDSKLLMHIPGSYFNGIEIQILDGEFGRVGYLCVHSHQICSSLFSLEIENEVFFFNGYLMEGAQKMKMPEDTLSLLISALLRGQTVYIYCENYFTILEPCNFSSQYKKFNR